MMYKVLRPFTCMNVAKRKGDVAELDDKIVKALPKGYVQAIAGGKKAEKKGDSKDVIDMTEAGLKKAKPNELKAIAEGLEIEITSEMKKDDVIEAILIANEE